MRVRDVAIVALIGEKERELVRERERERERELV
jgi:hypothetical protein